MTPKEISDWIALLEMFSDDHSLLQGAAGEDAMNVGDVLKMARQFRTLIAMYEAAVEVQGDEEVLRYVKSGNAVPVTRCTVSADLIRQLVAGKWIAVSERVPDEGNYSVLVAHEVFGHRLIERGVAVRPANTVRDWAGDHDDFSMMTAFWMPLPKPPESHDAAPESSPEGNK